MFVLEEFDKHKHDREIFTSSAPELTNYLRYYANQDQKRNLAKIYVAVKNHTVTERKVIYGYFSLSAYSLYHDDLGSNKISNQYKQIPAILIGRLAIQEKQTELRGYELLGSALLECKKISTQIGAQIIVVEALNEIAVNFYLKQGFLQLRSAVNKLYFPIQAINL